MVVNAKVYGRKAMSWLVQPETATSLTYGMEQMGHRSIQITVDSYGPLIPAADIAWADRLDSQTTRQPNATPAQPRLLRISLTN